MLNIPDIAASYGKSFIFFGPKNITPHKISESQPYRYDQGKLVQKEQDRGQGGKTINSVPKQRIRVIVLQIRCPEEQKGKNSRKYLCEQFHILCISDMIFHYPTDLGGQKHTF